MPGSSCNALPAALVCGLEGPKGPNIGTTKRPAHLAWIATLRLHVMARARGYAGQTPVGVMIVPQAVLQAQAKALFTQEPATMASCRVNINAFNWSVR